MQDALVRRVVGENAHPEIDIGLQFRGLREGFVRPGGAQAEQQHEQPNLTFCLH